MSALFDAYEVAVRDALHNDGGGPSQLAAAEEGLACMELELRSLPKANAQDHDALKARVAACQRALLAEKQRRSLLGDGQIEAAAVARSSATTLALGTHQLKAANRTLVETEQVAAATLGELAAQRRQLEGMHARVGVMQQDLKTSARLTKKMDSWWSYLTGT